ncbi:MAG: UvrD-helicase domain-containing protein [Bacteroidota bacterium]
MKLKIISAGAGSGKTYRLTQEMVGLLSGESVRASGIIATTFTNKAAAELQERVRVKLLEEGLTREANDLSNALIGTVHGLGVKLLKRFAFEAGVSPEVDIIAEEDQQLMFNQSLATVLTNERVVEMELLSERLGLKKSAFNITDWRKVLKDLTEVARSNGFSKDVLDKSRRLSFQTFSEFLETPKERSQDAWNAQLAAEIEDTITRLENNEDTTKKTGTAVKSLKEIRNELRLRGNIYWHQWVKLTKIGVGTKSREDVAPLVDLAAQHLAHQGFHDDIHSFISHIFDISQSAIEEFSRYKKSRGLIDYTDMEALVNQLLDDELVKTTLENEIDLLMVDEFQDTSPLQLEIFLKLSKLARYSVWVGDPKQSIYGFRGAEPALMNAIIGVQGGLKKENILAYSWRSREDIVYATNAIFIKAFPEMAVEQVALMPKRCKTASAESANKKDEPAEMGKALVHWHFQYDGEGRKPGRSWLDRCLAEQVSTLLERAPIILPKGEAEYRAIRPGDVAILCRSNKSCQAVADALHRAGLKAAISRAGLLNTAEAKLILACLKFILNKYDSLSIAEIMILASGTELEEVIEDRLEFLANTATKESNGPWGNDNEIINRINDLRQQVAELSSAEILTLLLEELNLRRIIISWGNNDQRLANVDQLIKWSFQYEEACNRLHSAASLGGFLLWLNDLENNGDDLQGAGENPLAVNVLTYHKSKGLEYPVVICHSLDQPLREDVWGLNIVQENNEVDLDNLLGNRWLRFWVNPYADQFRKTKLAEKIDASPAKIQKRKAALEEEARLLYVGITRARDYLVIPTYHNQPTWLNRVFFNGKADQPLMDPHTDISPLEWEGRPLVVDVEVNHFPASIADGETTEPAISALPLINSDATHLPYFFDDSGFNGKFKLDGIKYSAPLKLPEVIERKLIGDALVTYVNAEKSTIGIEQQKELAEHIIAVRDINDLVSATQLMDKNNDFIKWMNSFFEIKNIYRQYPVKIHFNDQFYESNIDLLLETKSGWQIIINHPFVGQKKQRIKKAKELSGKLLSMKRAVQAIQNIVSVGCYINFVLAGEVIKVDQ